MQLKPFEAGRYDDELIVVNNPECGRQELFTDREFEILKFLKDNEEQSLLALLMPNIGIAKKTHIEMCLRVLTKLRRMQIADSYAITGRKPGAATRLLELQLAKSRLEIDSLRALAISVTGIAGRALARLGQAGLLALVVGCAAASFALFPFDDVEKSLAAQSPSYATLLVLGWLTACVAFSLRTVVQAASLRAIGREALDPAFTVELPFVGLSADTRIVNLFGFKARAQLAMLGLVAPFVLGFLFTVLSALHAVGAVTGFVGFAACAGTTLALACPLLPFDGAELLQALFFRDELALSVSRKLRELTTARAPLDRRLALAGVFMVAWAVVWLDCLHSLYSMFAERISTDLAAGGMAGYAAGALLACLALLVSFPVLLVAAHQARAYILRRRKRVVVQKGKVKDSLTFEERIAALEKIPLFAYLNDQERLALLNEMEPAFYRGGDFLVHQGELGKEFFVLVKGQANAQYRDMAGNVTMLASLVEGDAFGEIALIDDVPRTANIVSDGGCIALVLRKDGFDRFASSLGSSDRVKALVRLTSFFRRHPLFSKLGPRDQAQLIDTFRFETITSGEAVSDAIESFHVIYSGVVRVDTGGADGETNLEADDCFGYSNPLRARFVALEGTGLLTVGKTDFHNLIWEKLVERPELFI